MDLIAFFSYLMGAYTEDSIRLFPVHGWCTAKRREAIDTRCCKGDSIYTYIYIYVVHKLFIVKVVRRWTRCQERLWNLLPWRFPYKTQLDDTWATPANFDVSPAFNAEDWTRWAPEFPSSLTYAVILRLSLSFSLKLLYFGRHPKFWLSQWLRPIYFRFLS